VAGGNLALNPHLRESINGGNGGHIFPKERDRRVVTPSALGRWPANLIHDGSQEVLDLFPESKGFSGGGRRDGLNSPREILVGLGNGGQVNYFGDSGSAARFFYCAKASKADRIGSKHPTVKPINLLRWHCRLITPPGGTILDMFAGSGTTGEAAKLEGFRAVLIEREAEYVADIERRFATDRPALLRESRPKRNRGANDAAVGTLL